MKWMKSHTRVEPDCAQNDSHWKLWRHLSQNCFLKCQNIFIAYPKFKRKRTKNMFYGLWYKPMFSENGSIPFWVNSLLCCCYFVWSCANHVGSDFQTYQILQCPPEFLYVCRFPLLMHVPNIQSAKNTWDFYQKPWLHRVKIPLHFLPLLSLDRSSSAIKSFSMPHIAQGCCEVRYNRNTEVQRH